MPVFLGVPLPPGTLGFAAEIENAVRADIEAALAEMLSIVTVEIELPQGDGTPRNYRQAEMPAVFVYCLSAGIEDPPPACREQGLLYDCHFGIVVNDAAPKTARATHERIRENIIPRMKNVMFGGVAFLSESHAPCKVGAFTTPAPSRGERNSPYTFWSDNSMRVTVIWPDPDTE